MVPVDYEPRALESGFGTAELGSDEDGSKHKVLGDLSVIPQVKAKFRTSLGALKCQNDCHYRCHNRLSRRILPRNLSTYLGHAFLGYSNLPWYLSSLVQCSEQTCRRSKNLTADLRYFLPTWFLSAVAEFNLAVSLHMIPLKIYLQTRNVIPYDSPILVCVQEGDTVGAKELLSSGKSSLNDVDPYGLGLLYVCILGHLRRTRDRN